MRCKKIAGFFFLNVLFFNAEGQNTTINQKNKVDREMPAAHKAMIIPFEPRLYISEIDHKINAETKLSAKQIKHSFRAGLNDQLHKAFKLNKYNVVDLMQDTIKFKKDNDLIYQHLAYDFQKVPNQENYQPPKKEIGEKKIEKGQLNVETDLDARFMNAKITSPKLVPILYGKYHTDIFVFINELEIKATGNRGPAELGEGNPNRKIIVHYTVYSFDAKEINSGIAETDFEPLLNNPKKIIEKHFSKIAELIVQRTNKGLGLAAK
jgi:hypothetical protein